MGGKTSKSTQTVSIPPEVLARYNAVNARAEEAAGRPFQPYSYNPADFVAQLTPTQLAGIQNVNYAAGQAQPYFDEATGQLMGAQMSAVPYYAQAGQDIGFGQQMGLGFQQQALQDLYGAQAAAYPLNYRAGSAYEQAYAQGQPFIGGAVGQFAQGQAQADPYQRAAGMNIAQAQNIGAQLAQQAYAQQAGAGAFAMPINQQAYADLARAYASGQPLNQAAVQQYYAGLGAAQPLQQYAFQTLGRAGGIGEQVSGEALGSLAQAGAAATPLQYQSLDFVRQALQGAQPLQQYALSTLGRAGQLGEQVSGQALGTLGQGLDLARPVQLENLARADQVYGAAQPFINRADVQYQRGLGGAEALQQYALQTLGQGQDISQMLSAEALQALGRGELRAEPLQQLAQGIYGQAYQAAQPFTQAALQQYYGGLGIAGPVQQAALAQISSAPGYAAPFTQAAAQNIAAAQAGVTPYQRYATELGLAGARPVTPGALTGREIQQYMSPYISNVVGQTQALLNQQAQQAQAGQLGSAIRSGAFGGDRAGIAAANLQQQQQLAQGKVLGDLLQSGFGQALGTAQQQQQLALGAEQANRAAQQAASAQLLGVGQAGFGQGMTAAQQQAALAQQLYGQQLGTGQAQAALAQQLFGQQAATGQNIAGLGQLAFGQGLSTGQAQQALAQQLFGQGATTSAQQQAIAESLFGRGATAAAQQAALGAQTFGQNQAVAQGLAALGQQQFGQGMANIAAREATAQALFGQSAQAAQQQAQIAQNLFGQGATQAAQQAALAQQGFGQGLAAAQQQQAVAQALFGQGATTAQQQAAIAQNLFGQGATQAAQQAALAQQAFGQNQAVGQNVAQMAQQLFGQGTGAAQAQAAIGQQGFAQMMQQAQQQQALSQLLYGQGTGAAQQQAALAQQLFGQGITGGQALLGAGQQAFQQGMGLGAAQQGLGQQVFGQGLSASQQQAALGQQGFGQQLAAAQARQGLGQGLYGMGAGTAQQLAALGTGAQGAALQGAQAQLAAGQAQQQTAQAGLQALYNQFLQQQAYPFQVAQFLGNIAMGTGALSGSTTTAVTPGGLFSDVRMKENIREVGKTFDGQPVYSYNYKGDDKTQMGMLAQEVEQKHPEAVGLAGGMKTVDYDKATRNSARKPVTIDGEYTASEGGPVSMAHAGERYARGGYANGGSPGLAAPGDMAALLAAQAQMFGPFSGAGIPTGGMPGMPGYVPGATLPVSELVTAGAMPSQPSAIEQMRAIADIGKTGQEIYQKYKDKQTSKSTVSSPETKAAGGATNPVPTALEIPDDPTEPPKLVTPGGEMSKGRTVIEDVKDIAQIAATAMAMFSDSRVKEDIKHIGHTHDGQKIYSYRYKGEPQTHIGLLAQEVEKKHPDAVGNIKGVKMVDYDAATRDAADRAVSLARGKADGGAAVMPYGAVPTALGIPTQASSANKLNVPDMIASGKSPVEELKDIADLAKSVSDINEARKNKNVGGRAGYQTNGAVRTGASGEWEESVLQRIKRELGEIPGDIARYAKGDYLKPTSTTPPPPFITQQPVATTPVATSAGTTANTSASPSTTRPAAPPQIDNRNVFPSSQFANLPESPADGLAAAAAPPPAPTGLAPTPAPSMPASLTGERDLGMAPMLGGTVKPAGLTPSKAEVVAKDRSAPVESRMDAFLKWVQQPENFIPLATGIAAATAAPTRDPFVALAQGLGAGAQAYQPVMQRKAEIDKIKAEADKVRAETGVFEASTLRELQLIADIKGLVPKEDPNGIYRVGDKRYSLVPVSQAIQKSGTGEVLPTGAAGAPTTGVLGKNALEAAQEAGTRFFLLPETTKETSRQQIDQSLAAGNKARNDLIDINRFAQSAALPRTPILEQGALFPIKNQLASFYDSLVTTFVKNPALQAQLRIDPASMTQAQISEKVAFGTAALREAGAGQRSLGALEAFLAGSPNQTQTRDTMVNLIADMIIHNQKLTDEAAAISEYDRIVETNSGLPRNFLYTDAVQAYQKDKPITAYERDRDQLVSIMMKDAYPEFVRAMKDPKLGPEMIQLLDNKYGKGFHRYFTGSVMQ